MDYMREYTISVLNDLIDVCRDEYLLFTKASQNINEDNLKQVFLKYSQEKKEQIIKLESEVKRLGGNIRESKSNQSAQQQLIFSNTPILLNECIKKDNAVIKRYSSAIKEDIMWEVIPLVAKQYFGSKNIHDQISSIINNFNQPVSNVISSGSLSS